jgi:2-dehydro-3-deoxyphosphogluconate aldolase/(4S)-4-hydroxy-2-oxoglutarate aldolase
MIPTGGVTLANVGEYIDAGAVALAVGAELVNEAALCENKNGLVTDCARQFVEAVCRAQAA